MQLSLEQSKQPIEILIGHDKGPIKTSGAFTYKTIIGWQKNMLDRNYVEICFM